MDPYQSIILHAQWIPGDRWLNVRGEGLHSFRALRPRPRYDRHPFLVTEPELRDALRAMTGPRRTEAWPALDLRESEHRYAHYRFRRQNGGDKLGVGEIGVLMQPFLNDRPAPSPELRAMAGMPPVPGDAMELRSISAPLLRMGPLHAYYFLTHIHNEPPPAVRGGATLRFYHAAARWVQALLLDGHFMPILALPDEPPRHRGAQRLRALWRLIPPPGPLSDERTRLITVSPALAAELSPSLAEGISLHALFDDFTAEMADTVLRRWASQADHFLGPTGTARRPLMRRPPVLEEWLSALSDESRSYDGLESLHADLQRWALHASAPADPDWRLALRLSEPADGGDDGPFSLEILWQHRREPLRLAPVQPAARAAAGMDGPAAVSATLLAALGTRLAALAVQRGWPLPPPVFSGSVHLTPAEALGFLEFLSPHLDQADTGLLAPAWWTGIRSGLTARLSLDDFPAQPGELAAEKLISFEWRLALGGKTLTEAEFKRLADAKGALVKLGGRWVALKKDDHEAVKKLSKMKARMGQLSAIGALRLAAGLDLPPGGLPLESVEAAGRMAKILENDKKFVELPEPAGFVGELRPYQRRGLSWLAYLDELGLGACLADDMGLGKTIQLLAMMAYERAQKGANPGPTLLVCPMSVVGNWRREAARFAPGLRSVIHHGLSRKEGDEFIKQVKESDLVITTYSLLQRDLAHLKPVIWRRVALDEAQNIKNPLAKQSRAARELVAAHRVALTGTPVENRLSELWSIMEFLNGGLLGTLENFNRQFAKPIEKDGDEYRATLLRRIIQPFLLRRLKTDRSIIADLPEKMEMEVACTLTREQAALYQAIVNEMLAKIDDSAGIERKGLILAVLTRLKQVCNHPALLPGGSQVIGRRSGKLLRLEEILEEAVEEGDQTLVFTQFQQMGELLANHLPKRLGCDAIFLHGGTTMEAREKMVADFQAGKPPIFILSLKAGGTGLNLTAARQVVHFDRWWNPAVEDQATDRAFRIGQTKNVQVRKFVCAGTLEERIAQMIRDKRALADRIVGGGEQWLTELSTGQIRELIALDPNAVADE